MIRAAILRLATRTNGSSSGAPPIAAAARCISTKRSQHGSNTVATAESLSAVSESDKYLHFSNAEGYFKTSPFDSISSINLPLDKYVWRDFQKWQDKVAVVCVITGRQYTFAELRDASAAFACRLQAKFNLGKNDVLAICLPNSPEYPVATLGAIEAGLTVTTVNPIYTAEEIARQLISSDAKFIVGTTIGYSILVEACKLAKRTIPIAVIRMSNEDLPSGSIDFNELSQPTNVDYSKLKEYEWSGDDLVFLPFSSGTTGLPKGVMLSHNNITANCEQVQKPIPIDTLTYQDVVPGILPFFHIYGLTVIMLSKLGLGAKIVTMPQFRPEDLMKSLNEYKGSLLNLVPPIALFMINHPKMTPETTPALRLVMSGAAPIGAHDVERFLKKFPNSAFLQGFGMTESSPVALLTPLDNTRYGSVGVLPGSTEAKIVSFDTENHRQGLGPNMTGELCIRGPQVMTGYLNNDEANKDSFYPGRWLRTGDVAFYDDDGYFYITDRMKELIKVKGFQVPPAELEAKLRDHPKILDAAVFGIAHEVNGEAPRAIVVLRPGEEASAEEIYDFIAEKVAHYKKLEGGVIFVDAIPKNPTGKILRRELKEKYSS